MRQPIGAAAQLGDEIITLTGTLATSLPWAGLAATVAALSVSRLLVAAVAAGVDRVRFHAQERNSRPSARLSLAAATNDVSVS